MSTESEGQIEIEGTSLYRRTWTPTGPIKAKLVFVHGFSEHINRYNGFFPGVTAHGIQVFAWDQRGWGRSTSNPAERGLTGPTTRVIADVAAFVASKLPSDAPVFVMGHSMGGGEVLTLAGDAQYADLVARVRGWLLECPFIGFTPEEEPSRLKVAAGRLVGRLLPRQQLVHEIAPERTSRDPAWVKSVRDDELCHNTGTLEGLAGLLDRTAALSSAATPPLGDHVRALYLAHGSDDQVCSSPAAMEWFGRQTVADRTAKSYEGGYHQLHGDYARDEFAKDIVEWILKRCDEDGAAAAGSKL